MGWLENLEKAAGDTLNGAEKAGAAVVKTVVDDATAAAGAVAGAAEGAAKTAGEVATAVGTFVANAAGEVGKDLSQFFGERGPEGPLHSTLSTTTQGLTSASQDAARALLDAVGTQKSGGNSHSIDSSAPVRAETPAEQAAQQIKDLYVQNHAPSQDEHIKPHANLLAGTDIGHPLGGSHQDTGAFADLIALAQNPAQSGLHPVAPAGAIEATAALHLASLGDAAGHPAAVHDDSAHISVTFTAAHDDLSHAAAPVVDHGHVGH
jgi:hypothetical protein